MPKIRMKPPSAPTIHTKRYSAFRGVDFSKDETQVDDSRSPRALNVVADAGGCPQKRLGWRCLAEVESPVRGIYRFETVVKSKDKENKTTAELKEYIIHAGSKLYRWNGGDDAPAELPTEVSGESSKGFMHDDKLYILTGSEMYYVRAELDEINAVKVISGNIADGDKDAAYIPLTRYKMGFKYSASTVGEPAVGGEDYESSNIVTPFRRNNMQLTYNLQPKSAIILIRLDENIKGGADISTVSLKTPKNNILIGGENGCIMFATKNGPSWVPTPKSNGTSPYLYIDHEKFTAWLSSHPVGEAGEGTDDLTIDVTITYPTATPIVEQPDGEKKEFPDYFDRIRKCRTYGWYNSRLFVTGNPDYPNADWFSEVGEPTYIKEINYTEIGNDDSAILGYLPAGDKQVVIKSDSIQLQDSSVGLRTSEWDDEIGYYFPVKRGITGTGALGFGSFATLFDDTMYLSKSGVMAVITENITGERVLHSRSSLVNNRLFKEPNLDKAITCVWNGYLLIAVNGNVYVADSRQKSYVRNESGNFEYEWYFWNNVPATCFLEHNGALYFGTSVEKKDGTSVGKICKFNTDLFDADGKVSLKTYSDWENGLNGDATAITAEWATKFDDDGDFMIKKNMVRRGCGVFLKGARKGNVKVLIRTDKTFEDIILAANRKRGIFTWEDLDFENFTFETMPRLVAAINKKIKKYSAIQVIVRSDEPNNDFGILSIERRFVTGNYEK
mgnify:CR=1 FL=1